jgi:signal peptidase I
VAVVTLLLAAAAWFCLGPVQLGGPTSYAIANGVSMLPRFHAGDLVILRRESSYHVGEVAAYHNGQLGIVVMHRIIAINNGHYEFKGDNNTFADSFEPTKAQIVGAEWIHLPGLGRYVLKLRNPAAAALLLALLWLGAFWPGTTTRRRRRRHRNAR